VDDDASQPARRVIGHILSLGFPMPGPLVDNYNFLTAPSFFDYDAIVVEPSALSQLIEDVARAEHEVQTFAGRAVRNEPREPQDESLADVLLRRRDETSAALENGAVIVCFAHPALVHRSTISHRGRRIARTPLNRSSYSWPPSIWKSTPRTPVSICGACEITETP